MMQYNDLHNWYNNAFVLTQINKMFTLTEYENMHPFEFEIYNIMLQEKEKAESDQAKVDASLQRALQERGY